MRKTGLFLLLAGLAVFGASCTKTDTPPNGNPISITVSPMTTTANGGDSVTFHVTITDDNTLKDVVVSQSLGGGTETQVASYSLSGKSYSFDQGYRVPAGFTGDIKIKFLVDDASNTNTATATITVGSAAADFNSYSAVLLASYNDATAGSFYASSNNNVYTVSSVTGNTNLVDLIFYYGSSNMYTLAGPTDGSFGSGSGQISSLGVQNWSSPNNTQIKITSLSDFSSIKAASDIMTAYNNASASADTKATKLAAGNIIAFKTAAGKYGLAKVLSVSSGDASTGKGVMQIQVDVQK